LSSYHVNLTSFCHITGTLQSPKHESHNKCRRQAEKLSSVSPWRAGSVGAGPGAGAGAVTGTGTAACGAWTLSGARTRTITRALVAAEVAPPPLPQQQQPRQQQPRQQQQDGDREVETETGLEMVVGGPRDRPRTGTGTTNQVALRLRRWVAATSVYWRPAETASVHQIDDYCVANVGEGEGPRAAMEAATLRDVLVILNAAPRTDEEPVGCDTNLMEAGFDSLQVVDLRRQLQAAAPAGTAVLIASALMEHPTAAGLVAHMMQTWQPPRPRPAGNGGQRRATTSPTAAALSSVAEADEVDRSGVSGGGFRTGASLGIEDDDAHAGATPGCFGCRRRSKARHANNNERNASRS